MVQPGDLDPGILQLSLRRVCTGNGQRRLGARSNIDGGGGVLRIQGLHGIKLQAPIQQRGQLTGQAYRIIKYEGSRKLSWLCRGVGHWTSGGACIGSS